MKRSILYMGSLCLLLALGGCRGDDRAAEPAAPASAAPTPTVAVRLETETPAVTPEVLEALTKGEPDMTPVEVPPETAHEGPDAEDERILAYCVSIKDALPCTVDLDGDGTMETVDMTTRPEESDGCPRWAVSVTRGDQVKLAETDILDDMPWDLWVGDLDEDGSYEIFFHGDEASDDYIIYAWRHDLTPISFEPDDRLVRGNCEQDLTTFAGYVEGFEDGHMVIQGFVDMLGTHWGVRTFAIGDDGVIGPMSTVWAFEGQGTQGSRRGLPSACGGKGVPPGQRRLRAHVVQDRQREDGRAAAHPGRGHLRHVAHRRGAGSGIL